MNAKKIMRLGVMLLLSTVMLTVSAFSATWYVNSTNGDDLINNGLAATQTSVGIGPYLTIAKAITSAADGDTISVAAGAYGEANVSITKSVTLVSTAFLASSTATITNGVTMNGASKTANMGRAADGSVNFSLAGANALVLTAGTLNVDGQTTIASGGTTTRTNGALTGTPTTTNVNVIYNVATGDVVAGPETPASLGTGVLTVNNGGNTVTFPTAVGVKGATGAINVTGSAIAVFSSNVTSERGNITNSSSGNLTISGSVTFDPKDGNAPGAVVNSGSGKTIVTGPVTVLIYNINAGTSVSNSAAGELDLNGGVVFSKTSTGTDPAADVTATLSNGAAGKLVIVGVTANSGTFGTNTRKVLVTLTNVAAGEIDLGGGTITGNVLNDGGGKIKLTASTTFAGNLSQNNAASTIQLGSNTLTLSGAATYTANAAAKIFSDAAATIGLGTLSITGGCASLQGELPNVSISKASTISAAADIWGNLTITDALTIGAATTVEGNASIGANLTLNAPLTVNGTYSQSIGTLALNAQTLTLKKDVTMTGGTVNAGNGVVLLNSASNQLFTPLPNLVLYDLTINSAATGLTVTLGASVIVQHNLTITTGKLELSTYNVRMNTAGGTFANGGDGYTSSGGGTLIFEAGGTISGAGTFSNLDIRCSGGIVTVGSGITFSGNLYLREGVLAMGGNSITFSNILVRPAVFKNVAPAAPGEGTISTTGGVIGWNTATTDYDLTYQGDASWTIAGGQMEWQAARLHNLTIATGSTTSARTVTAPGGAIVITGSLTVNQGQTFDLATGTLTAGTANAAHSVVGTVTNGILSITGDGETVTGSTVTAAAASVQILSVTGATFTSNNLKNITALTYNKTGGVATVNMNTTTATVDAVLLTAGTLNLTMNSTTSVQTGNLTLTAGSLNYTRNTTTAAQQNIGGNVTLTAGTLTLGSSVDVTGTTSQVDGNLALVDNNYTAKGAYSRTGTGTVTGTGKLIIKDVALAPGGTFSVPNLEFQGTGTTSITAGLTVTNSLTQTSGATALGADLTVSGPTVTFTAGSFTGTGKLVFTGATTTITAAADMSVAGGITANTTASTLLFRSDKETASTPVARVLTCGGLLTQTKGTIDLGINKMTLLGNYTHVAGAWAMATGGSLELASTAPPCVITQGTGLSIPNLTITNLATAAAATQWTITGVLKLANILTIGSDTSLVMASGSTIDITNAAGSITKIPVFPADNNITVIYDATVAGGTAKELAAIVKDLTIKAAIQLNANVTVNGNLSVGAALTTAAGKSVTMGPGATLTMNTGGTLDKPVSPATEGLNLVYNGVAATSNNDWPAGANIASLLIKAATTLHANRTVQGSLTLSAALDLSTGGTAFNLTTLGDVEFKAGGAVNSTIAGGQLIFAGSATQALKLAANWAVPANVRVHFAKSPGTTAVNLSGANLDFATAPNTIYLDSGVVNAGSQAVILARPIPANTPFVQAAGVIVGKARYQVNTGDGSATVNSAGVFIYPLGTAAANLRPITIAFNPNYVAFTTTVLDAEMVDSSPGGSKGLPITESATLKIGGYPNFFWRVTGSMLATQNFDVETQSDANIGYSYDRAENLRLIRRQDGDVSVNAWTELGTFASYLNNNYIASINGKQTLFVRSSSAAGGITAQGTIFTIGVPTRPPAYISVVGQDSVEQVKTDTLTFTADARNVNDSSTFTVVAQPATGTTTLGATTQLGGGISQVIVYYNPTYSTPAGSTVSITVRATNTSGLTADTTKQIVVKQSLGVPSWTTSLDNITVTDGPALTATYAVSLPAGNTARFRAVGALPGIATLNATTGAFSWTVPFAAAGHTFTVIVRAYNNSDTTLAVNDTAVITVNHRYVKGDADGIGGVLPADASRVLQFAAGILTSLGDSAHVWAADASANGTVTAYDASLILQYAAGIITTLPPTGKAPAAAGALAWGKVGQKDASMLLPLRVSDASNITSVQFIANIGSLEIEAMRVNLPKDWQVYSKVVDGKLLVAAAGVTPISDGEIATIVFKKVAYQSTVDVVAEALMNESIIASIQATMKPVPSQFALENNYPNPFNPTTTIKYALPQDARVNVTIYNIQGQIVRTLVNTDQQAGYYTMQWDGRSERGTTVASGIYIYRINAGQFVSTKKMVMLK